MRYFLTRGPRGVPPSNGASEKVFGPGVQCFVLRFPSLYTRWFALTQRVKTLFSSTVQTIQSSTRITSTTSILVFLKRIIFKNRALGLCGDLTTERVRSTLLILQRGLSSCLVTSVCGILGLFNTLGIRLTSIGRALCSKCCLGGHTRTRGTYGSSLMGDTCLKTIDCYVSGRSYLLYVIGIGQKGGCLAILTRIGLTITLNTGLLGCLTLLTCCITCLVKIGLNNRRLKYPL